MNKRKVIRFELLALVLVVALLLYRVITGPPPPDGFIVFDDIESAELKQASFQLDAPDTMFVTATGSFEGEGRALAAYAWILRRDDRSVAWQMRPEDATRDRGTVAQVEARVPLKAGTYDVYFASYGNRNSRQYQDNSFWRRLGDQGMAWLQDEEHWQLVLKLSKGALQHVQRLGREDEAAMAPMSVNRIWTSAPMHGRHMEEYLFEVRRTTAVHVYAVGELDSRQMDHGWIENVLTGERVWEMVLENTAPAGGWDVNRRFDGDITLPAGIYRAAFESDPGHSYMDWYGNPPFDPAGWGLTLSETQRGTVAAFDPWTNREPFVSLTRVTNDETRSAQFAVKEPARLVAYSLGEVGSSPYDYAWIKNNDTHEMVWEMSRDASVEAGGDDSNREELAFLELNPGTYTVYYQTDGSHAFDDWRNGEPNHPERWGVTLFPLAVNGADASAFELIALHNSPRTGAEGSATPTPAVAPMAPAGPPPPPLGTGGSVLRRIRLGNEARQEAPLHLDAEAKLHIYALGEISLGGRYDYGWIERRDTGEIVWDMTWQNTRPAGGDDRNRLFDGVIALPAGQYTVYFRTDFSHAFGDFGDRAPDNSEQWGITIEKL